jgi:putative chitinase
MNITPATLAALAKVPVNTNMASTIRGLLMRPGLLSAPHRLACYLGQLGHESGCWRYDREIWGPTAAQKRYDTRTDLGNTAAADGDGFTYRGRGPVQITGKANYAAFTVWARKVSASAPDFVASPDLVVTDPWEGLGPIWYWETHGLSALADRGDDAAITKAINGGYNGLSERVALTDAARVLLSGAKDIRSFQLAHALNPDGIIGPITRGVLHRSLSIMPPVLFAMS